MATQTLLCLTYVADFESFRDFLSSLCKEKLVGVRMFVFFFPGWTFVHEHEIPRQSGRSFVTLMTEIF